MELGAGDAQWVQATTKHFCLKSPVFALCSQKQCCKGSHLFICMSCAASRMRSSRSVCFFCNKANVVKNYCFTKWGRGFLFLSDDCITFFLKTVPHKRIQTQIQRIRRQWWCVQWWNDICTHAIIITVKSSQFHGSLKNVNGTVQKPLANIFIADSNV